MTSHPMPTSRRLLFYTLYLAYIAAGIISILPGPTLSLLAAHTGVSLEQGSWIFTVSATGFTLGAVLAGSLGRKLSPKTVLMIGLFLMGSTGLAIPFTHSFPILLISQFTRGLGFGLLDVSINILTALAFHDTLGETLNGLHSSFGIGSLVAPLLLSATLTIAHDFTWAYLVGSIAALACVGLLLRQRAPTSVPASSTRPGQVNEANARAAARGPSRSILWQLLLWLMALEFFLYIACEVGFSNWIVTAVSLSASISLALAAPAATAFWLGLTASRLLSTQVLKRALLSEKQLLYLCIAGGSASGLLVAFFSGRLFVAFVTSALFGFFLGPLYPLLTAIASRWFVHALNTISGVLLVSCGISAMIFPLIMGVLLTAAGISWAMAIPPLGCLLMIVPLSLATRQQRLTLQLQRQEHTIEETLPLPPTGHQ